MSRPTGWDVVGYWGDPVPGDVWEIRALARKYTKIGEAAEDAQQRLKSVKGSGWLTAWDADSGDVFIDKIESMPGDLEACADSYIELGSTLQTWADDVDDAQYTADKALAEAKDAKEDEATAASSLSGAQSTYNTYNNQVIAAEKLRDKYPDGEGAPSGTKVLTDYQFKALKNNRTVASNRVNELSGDISDASSRVEAAKKLVQEAHGDWTTRETATVTAIGKSADAGLGEQSFWDKIFGSEVWETIITVCKIVVAIGGIIVMIIGGPLAWIVLAAALLVLADTLYKMSKGQADGWDLAFALLDCIPGAKGLTTAAGLIGGAAALIKGGKGLLGAGKLALKGLGSFAVKNVNAGILNAKKAYQLAKGSNLLYVGKFDFIRTGALHVPDAKTGFIAADTFRTSTYTQSILIRDQVLYRIHDAKSGATGSFLNFDMPGGPFQSQLDNAIKPEWNQFTHISEIKVPAGTPVAHGPAAPQTVWDPASPTKHPMWELMGGGDQVYIKDVKPEWVIKTSPL
jgi:uncharacterized protein YukE